MANRGDFGEILLYKAAQGAMLRSNLNTNFTDLQELEFHIRKETPAATHSSTRSILKDHYARNVLFSASRPTSQNLAIPLKHRRSDSKDDPQRKYTRPKSHRSTPHLQVTPRMPFEVQTSRTVHFSDPLSPDLSIPSVRVTANTMFRSTTGLSRKSLLEARSEGIIGLQEHCEFTSSRIREEKKSVLGEKSSILHTFEGFLQKVDHALKIDKRGYIPKSLKEYKEKRAKLRAERGEHLRQPQRIHLKKDVVKEYRSDLLKKALAHGIDKDLRYVYTFGTISATNT